MEKDGGMRTLGGGQAGRELGWRQYGRIDYTFGATLSGDGYARFRLWAPGVARLWLAMEGEPPQAMDAVGGGFYELRRACVPGARYRYCIGENLYVPDPASRLQNGDVHDASIVVDTSAYPWRNEGWRGRPWTDTVLYEVHVGLAGGFQGVRAMLADLAGLGITAIELMPIADFPGPRNWGYDGVLPYAPDCAYGSPDDLKALVDDAHGLGMMVFLDVVYNHFGPDGNYLASYAPDFFREDIATPWGPAIDFRRPQVRAFFAENALYWLNDYRFDGLRLDAVHAIADPDWLPEMARFVRDRIEPGRHVHLVLENDDNTASLMTQGFDAQWNDDAHHVLHKMLTGETQGYYSAYQHDSTGKLARCLAEGFIYQGQPSPLRSGRPRGEPSASLAPSSFVFFLQNHDQIGNRAMGERLITLCGSDSDTLHAAVALQMLAPHIPLLFMGEEHGATEPFQYFTSFNNPQLACAVREGRRKEFAGFHQFSDPRARDLIPDPNDVQTWERCKIQLNPQDRRAMQWRDCYSRLLRLRHEFITPYLAGARSESVHVLTASCLVARWRLGNGSLLSLYCNFSVHDIALPVNTLAAGEFIVYESKSFASSELSAGRVLAASTTATLIPGRLFSAESKERA